MATREEISACFQELNIETTDAVLNKCLEMCLNYNIGAEDFCDQWYSFTASNLNGAAPSLEHLDKLERKEFQKNKDRLFTKQAVTTPKSSSYKVTEDLDASNYMVGSNTATTPKSSHLRPTVQTPTQGIKRQNTTINNEEQNNLSNITDSPSVNHSEKFSQRSDSRSVQCSYGLPSAQYKREKSYSITVRNANEEQILNPNVRYMYETMGKKASCLNNMTDWLGQGILHKYGLSLTPATIKSHMGELTTYGRIVSDSDGKINIQSVLLEGTRETNLGQTVTLNLNKMSKLSLFPGQVAVVQGKSVSSALFAEKIFTDAHLDLPVDPPVVDDTTQIVVASGPFTFQSNLSYEPLNDLLKYVSEYKPHVLLLIGPFIERDHSGIHDGSLLQSFDTFFESLIENIMNSLKTLDIQVVIVASQKDAHHHPVYPTPPYTTREKYENLTFLSDPCMVNINGLVIGATSADILFHIGNYEMHSDKNPSGPSDRMGRLASHLLNQQSFYPLYPPHKGMSIDHEQLEQHGIMEVKPHVLILPSNLRHFVKSIQDCLVINPERLTKGYVAGTFARIEVSSGTSTSVCNRVNCQILRV